MSGSYTDKPETRPTAVHTEIQIELPVEWHALLDGKVARALFMNKDDANDFLQRQEDQNKGSGLPNNMQVQKIKLCWR